MQIRRAVLGVSVPGLLVLTVAAVGAGDEAALVEAGKAAVRGLTPLPPGAKYTSYFDVKMGPKESVGYVIASLEEVDERPVAVPRDSSVGDLPGQWPEEFGGDTQVSSPHRGVCGLVRLGDSSGILPALSQQIQSNRTLLVVAATQVERRAADLLGSGASMCLTNDMVW